MSLDGSDPQRIRLLLPSPWGTKFKEKTRLILRLFPF
jgi:hypothetical protein